MSSFPVNTYSSGPQRKVMTSDYVRLRRSRSWPGLVMLEGGHKPRDKVFVGRVSVLYLFSSSLPSWEVYVV